MVPLAPRSRFLIAALVACCASISSQVLVFPPYLHSYGIHKATQLQLTILLHGRTHFDDPQGLATVHLKSWNTSDSSGPSTDRGYEVVVYGVNAGRGEIIYNKSMWSLGLYGKQGSGNGQLLSPRGIAADENGNVYVADSGNNRIVRLFNPKSALEWRGAFTGASGSDPGLAGPSRVGLDESGRVYVTDPGHSRIVVFDSVGTVFEIVPDFRNGPTALAVADGSAPWSYFTTERALFCADESGTRLWKLGFDGRMLARGRMPAGYSASYGTVDYYHSYWVTDTRRHCVLKFDHDLKLLDIFGAFGRGDNQFEEPRGITILKRFGQTFIAEKKGAQYFWVGTELRNASLVDQGKGSYAALIRAKEYSFASLFSADGGDTETYFKNSFIPCESTAVCFRSGKNPAGKNLTLRLEPTYSSRFYRKWDYPIHLALDR